MKKIIILVIVVFLSLTSYASAKLQWSEVSDDVVPNLSVWNYVKWHNATSYLGHSDWRLPTRLEVLERKGKVPNAQIWVRDSCYRDINPDNPGGIAPMLCRRQFQIGDAPEAKTSQMELYVILIREY
jgi:hypothetical protein